MRSAFFAVAVAALLFGARAALAQVGSEPSSSASQLPPPLGWSIAADSIVHEESTTRCTNDVAGFLPLRLSGPVEPNVLGTCHYEDPAGGGDVGIQVRRYMRGVGESRDAIVNDRMLMEPRPGSLTPGFAARMLPVKTRDGQMGGLVIITKVRNGFLVDCFAEGRGLEEASKKIALICGN